MKQNHNESITKIPNPKNGLNFFPVLIGVGLIALLLLSAALTFSSTEEPLTQETTNQFKQKQREYLLTFDFQSPSNDLTRLTDHYKIVRDSVFYYHSCNGAFGCIKDELEGVKVWQFEPLSKDYAKVHKNTGISIYNRSYEIITGQKAENFSALGLMTSNSPFYTDGNHVYHYRQIYFDNKELLESERSLPIKISPATRLSAPLELQTIYSERCTAYKVNILFVDDEVFLDHQKIKGADAETFQEIEFSGGESFTGPWFKDKNHVYFLRYQLDNVNPKTFLLAEKINPETKKDSVCTDIPKVAYDDQNLYNLEKFSGTCSNTSCLLDKTYSEPYFDLERALPAGYEIGQIKNDAI